MLHGYCGVNKVSVTGTQLEVLYDHEDSGIISTATSLLVFFDNICLAFLRMCDCFKGNHYCTNDDNLK